MSKETTVTCPLVDQQDKPVSESLETVNDGLTTTSDFSRFMVSVMKDTLSGAIQPKVANAVTNAGGKVLKAITLQHQFGEVDENGKRKPVDMF
jgi:hypothetical protein